MLCDLADHLRTSLGILHKQDIQTAAQHLNPASVLSAHSTDSSKILLGDDCAAIPDHGSYLLLAAEGLLPQFIESDPWFAGWCAVMVNVSDVYAMGGRAIAIVDTIWSSSDEATQPIFAGMQAAATAYDVPIVGGHTNTHSPHTALSAAILGRANRLISSFSAQPGDVLVMATDFRGASHPRYTFWNAATTADPKQLRDCLSILPAIAESGLCDAGKDISMGGLIGTLMMLLETSGCGAVLNLNQVPVPSSVGLEKWLLSFPSYGFILSLRPNQVSAVQSLFRQHNLVCEAIGTVEAGSTLRLQLGDDCIDFWDVVQRPLTGFGRSPLPQSHTSSSTQSP